MSEEFLHIATLPEREMAVLEVLRDSIEMADWDSFVASCHKLMETGQPHLVLDLRRLRRVLSVFIGEAIQLNAQAKSQNRRFTVLASGDVREVFHPLLGTGILELITDGRSPAEIGEEQNGRSRWKAPPRA